LKRKVGKRWGKKKSCTLPLRGKDNEYRKEGLVVEKKFPRQLGGGGRFAGERKRQVVCGEWGKVYLRGTIGPKVSRERGEFRKCTNLTHQ